MNIFTSENVNIVTFLITILGFYFAYFQYFKVKKERKRHLLKILDVQLNCLGPWVGSDNGNGYGDELTEEQKYDNALPSKVIYGTGSSPLIDLNILEAMADVPDEIISEIDQLYYDLIKIESIQNYRNLLTSSDLKLSYSVNQKIINYRTANSQLPFHHFLMDLKDKDYLEKQLIEQLISYGQTLHCIVIGNKNHGACQHWSKTKEWVKKEKINALKPDIFFIALTTVIVYISILYVSHLFLLPLNELNIKLISVIITIIFSLLSNAVTCEYFASKLGRKTIFKSSE